MAFSLAWDNVVMVHALAKRTDLNDRAARVLADHPREDGRIPIEMFIGQERVWIKRDNLLGPIPNEAALQDARYKNLPDTDRDDVKLFFFANRNSTRIPGLPGRVVSLKDPAPAPAPAAAAIPSSDHENPWDFSDSEDEPAPAPDRARSFKAMQAVARNHSIKEDLVYECPRCKAHRPLAYRCCGMYLGTRGEDPVPRRNVHAHPEADEDEVDDFLAAHITRLDRASA